MPKAPKQKPKKEKEVHPNSRKASQLSKRVHRQERLQKRKGERDAKVDALCEKVKWFQDQLDADKEKYSLAEVSDLISKYINRFSERLEEIRERNELNKQQQRHGLSHQAEESALNMVMERETNLFETGEFEAPDMVNRANLKIFKSWSGEVKDISNVKLRKYRLVTAKEMVMDT